MLGVTFICVGRMREAHFIAAFAEYEKRLGALCRFELKEIPETKLPERPAEAEIAAALKKEGEAIEKALPRGALTVAMCIEGRQTPSEGLARMLAAAGGGRQAARLLHRRRLLRPGRGTEAPRGREALDVGDDVPAPPGEGDARRAGVPGAHDKQRLALS